jgi:hypothetical protein
MRYPDGCPAAEADNFKIILTANDRSVFLYPGQRRARPQPGRRHAARIRCISN